MDYTTLAQRFQTAFGSPPTVGARAPGRVNLIGEHTDYNGGYVLPFAINRETVVLARPRRDMLLCIHAANMGEATTLDLRALGRSRVSAWADYIAGVAAQLQQAGHEVPGANLIIQSDVPIGCGLSSSAALEMAVLRVFEELMATTLSDEEAARLGQRVENEFLGLSSGIMDQFVSRAAMAGHALYLNCDTLAHEHVPVNLHDTAFVIADSAQSRSLTGTAYNERVAECAEALQAINQALGAAHANLSAIDENALEGVKGDLPPLPFRRARHVITENARTRVARDALVAGDAKALGRLMNASHASLRVDYEVTGDLLDVLVNTAMSIPGCLGARMTGAGFGGCTINLVSRDHVDQFSAEISKRYRAAAGKTARVFWTDAMAGSELLRDLF